MSMVANLNEDDMTCCPACGEYIEVYEDDLDEYDEDGIPEYWVICPECYQSFYASKKY